MRIEEEEEESPAGVDRGRRGMGSEWRIFNPQLCGSLLGGVMAK